MIHEIATNLYELRLGAVNAHLLTVPEGLLLIDTGSAGDTAKITAALAKIGHGPADLTHIIVTHCHADHAGGLAALQQQTSAQTIMYWLDGEMVENGVAKRPLQPIPGLLNKLLYRTFIAPAPNTIAPARIDHKVKDNEVLPLGGGLRVIHVPGHSAGQMALLWEEEQVLFAADAVMNQPWLGYSLGYEDFALGQKSAARLADLDFALACFGHGKPLRHRARARFQEKFNQRSTVRQTAVMERNHE